MYLAPWQVLLLGCIIGTLISFIVLTLILVQILGRIGIKGLQTDRSHKVEVDLIGKICLILLAKGYFDEMDNNFMLDKVSFNDWKEHVEEELAELESEELEEEADEDN